MNNKETKINGSRNQNPELHFLKQTLCFICKKICIEFAHQIRHHKQDGVSKQGKFIQNLG